MMLQTKLKIVVLQFLIDLHTNIHSFIYKRLPGLGLKLFTMIEFALSLLFGSLSCKVLDLTVPYTSSQSDSVLSNFFVNYSRYSEI